MKKYLKLLFVAFFASMSFAFVACGDDDDEPDFEIPSNPSDDNNEENEPGNDSNETASPFVGTWEMTTSGVLGEGDGETYMQIASDHTFILINEYGYGVEVSYGTWKSSKDSFTINYEIFHGASPIVPSVTYKIESTASKSFVLALGTQKFTFTKMPDSVMDQYQDEIDDVMGGNNDNSGNGGNDTSSSLTLNGTIISNILSSSVENNTTFTANLWYDNFIFAFEFRYNGKVSNLASGENITDKIDIKLCESLNHVIVDGRYEILSGWVRVDSKTSNSITLNYSNLKIQQYVGHSKGNVYTLNGKISYSL